MEILVETSARHVHLAKEHLDILFGKDYELTKKKDLSQPGQYACEERVDIVGPKKTLPGVSILGPVRPATQVELSATDARSIGIATEIRESGSIDGTAGCKIVGPCGEVEIAQGVIIAKRHLHLIPETAEKLGLNNGDTVSVEVKTEGRSLIFGDVVARVSEKFADAMHIDTDESNAASCGRNQMGTIIK